MTNRCDRNRVSTRRPLAIACATGLLSVAGFASLRAADAPALINPNRPGSSGGTAAAAGGAAGAKTPFNDKAATAVAGDMAMWGGTPHRNMVSAEKNAPTEWDVESGKNIKWSAELGSKSYGNPIISNGKVYVGTNNEAKKDPKTVGPDGSAIDGGVLMAFDEKTGKFLWQKYHAKLPSGRVNDWPGEGLCSTVYAEQDRVWYCSNRCEVVCLDASASEPREVWKLDMMKELGVFPHNMTSAAITTYGDYLYVITGNGVDDTHKNVVAPKAPGIVCVDKNTGKVIWTDNAAGENVLHGQWSSVAITEIKRADGTVQPIVIAPLGDGWVYAYDAKTGQKVWWFDTNPKDSVYPQTRNEIIATPVIVGGRMYISNGQDPEHGTGRAHTYCVDITKTGDISAEISEAAKPKIGEEMVKPAGEVPSRKGKPNPNSGVVWHFHAADRNGDGKIKEDERFHRTICTAAVYNGLVFIPDFSGYLHCIDADTGKQLWCADLEAEVWGSPLVVDGKVYVGDGDGDVAIFEAAREMKEVATINMGAAVYGSPVMANGTMYIMSMHKLFAVGQK